MDTKTYDMDELSHMSADEFNNALLDAVEIKGTALVRTKEGVAGA